MKHAIIACVLVMLFITIGCFTGGGKLMAQETGKEDIQKKIEDLKKQKELLEAEKALLEAQKALDKAKEPLSTTEKEIQDKLAVAKAEKDLADAQKARSDAQLAAFKSSLGEVPQGPYSGSVDLKDKGSELPVALLATQAVKTAALKIAKDLNAILTGDNKGANSRGTLFVYASSEVPTFQNLAAYNAQLIPANEALQVALDQSYELGFGPSQESAPVFGAVGYTLDAVNKLLGFFRTDYTLGGAEVALDDSILVLETASQFAKQWTVKLPALYNPDGVLSSETKIFKDLKDLSVKKVEAISRAERHEKYITSLNNEVGQEKDPKKKEELINKNQPLIKIQNEVAAQLRQAATFYDQFFVRMTTVNEKTSLVPISIVAKEAAVFDTLKKSNEKPVYLLVLHIHKSGGGYLIKKNFWTFFGSMPIFYLGGTVVTYALLKGLDGSLYKSGVIPVYGGYVKASGMQKALND